MVIIKCQPLDSWISFFAYVIEPAAKAFPIMSAKAQRKANTETRKGVRSGLMAGHVTTDPPRLSDSTNMTGSKELTSNAMAVALATREIPRAKAAQPQIGLRTR